MKRSYPSGLMREVYEQIESSVANDIYMIIHDHIYGNGGRKPHKKCQDSEQIKCILTKIIQWRDRK